MNDPVELNGRSYRWSGGTWLDAQTYMPPPGIIRQELNHRYGYLVEEKTAVQKKPRSSSENNQKVGKGIQKTIGPIMLDFIYCRCAETDDFVHGSEITQHLLGHPEATAFLRQAYEQTDRARTFEVYVGNQVSWLAANLDDPNRPEYDDLIEKAEMFDGKVGFRPKWHDFVEGEVSDRDAVVETIKRWLPKTGQQKLASKKVNLEIIAQGPKQIRFMPQGEGWGRSPGNAACWADAATGKRLK